MNWIVFSYSLPATSRSSPRVAVWRRLGRLGAIAPTSGVYVLPARDECVEAFQWLAQETRQAKGEALVMRVEQFEGVSDRQLIDLFNQARKSEYAELDAHAAELEKAVTVKKRARDASDVRDTLAKLRKQYLDIARVDYFDCPEAGLAAARLDNIERALAPTDSALAKIAPATLAEYHDKRWVTRPRPHVDRLACVWLIRRFINPHAAIRYSARPEPDEVAFDMHGARFGHVGRHCTFETMLEAFGLDESALRVMAEIVHEIDLRDGQYNHPNIEGIDSILSGWLLANLTDAELEAHGIALFEGLYAILSNLAPAKSARHQPKRSRK
jgi:hypothetical protein